METHAYEWIHTVRPEEIYGMKFDVIIGNPPYQLGTGGGNAQAIPLYNQFVENSKKLNPRYLAMIIPARWFAGGMNLNEFRLSMLNDRRIRILVDYPNAKDCFPNSSIGGGVCYFLWDRDHEGDCRVTNISQMQQYTMVRRLNEYKVFVRYNEALMILRKVSREPSIKLTEKCSSLAPFGIMSNSRGSNKKTQNMPLRLFSSKGIGYISWGSIKNGKSWIGKYKVMVSKTGAEHAGEPDKNGMFKVLSKVKVLYPNDVCTFSYFLIGMFNNELEAKNLASYLCTRFVRFLILLAVSSINLTKDKFQFVPLQDFSKPWTDEELYKKYDLTEEEISFIESMIKPMKLDGDADGQ